MLPTLDTTSAVSISRSDKAPRGKQKLRSLGQVFLFEHMQDSWHQTGFDLWL